MSQTDSKTTQRNTGRFNRGSKQRTQRNPTNYRPIPPPGVNRMPQGLPLPPRRDPYNRKWNKDYELVKEVRKYITGFNDAEIHKALSDNKYQVASAITHLQEKKKTAWSHVVREGILPDASQQSLPPPPSAGKQANGSANGSKNGPKKSTNKENKNPKTGANQTAKAAPVAQVAATSNDSLKSEPTPEPVVETPPKDKLQLLEEALKSVDQSRERALDALKSLIEDYKLKVESLNDKKKKIQESKQGLFNQIAQLDENIKGVDKDIETIEAELQILNARVKEKVESQTN
eukprot:TRINITY_DN11838_c0_g1_i1.p1 TRINITY_DN11838_c0_g1~~TRINITY_DN11838_c0_g1_i1.p1  ORF type:complete len:313 (-),score=73.40 TRINITY_DN11838_c0_g1_i1:62-928(-)